MDKEPAMADEEAPAEEQDQPEETPEQSQDETQPEESNENEGGEESFFDFDPSQVPEDADREWLGKRHQEMQRAWTQKTQTLAEQRREAQQVTQILEALQNPETAPEVARALGLDSPEMLQALGYEIEDDEYEGEGPDPMDEIQSIRQELAERDQMQAEQQMQSQVAEDIDAEFVKIEDKLDRQFDDRENNLLSILSTEALERGATPDEAAQFAYQELTELYSGEKGRWMGKKNAPRVPGSGVPASKAADLSTSEGRLEAAAAAAEAAMASD